jgi:T-complex protein 1 subunit delta
MSHMQVFHPTAKMLVELSKAQDIEAGDGTTSVVVLCGSMLDQCAGLLEKGIHPTVITEVSRSNDENGGKLPSSNSMPSSLVPFFFVLTTQSFEMAAAKAEEVLESVSIPVDLADRDQLIKAATTSLASKVVSASSEDLAPLAVDSVLSIIDPKTANNVDLNDIKVVKALGGTIDETELVNGLVFTNKVSHVSGAPTRVTNAKIGLIQFHLSAPKTDIENQVVVSEYSQMDRILKEERAYILNLCKKIQSTGCNVLLVQKSILRDSLNDMSLLFLAKMKVLVVRDVERDDIEFISKTLGCMPVAHVDSFTADKLGRADLVEEISLGGSTKVTKITGVANPGRTVSLLVRGSNRLVLDETERSLHDALCVVRSIVKKKFLIAGGGAPETEVSLQLNNWSKSLTGMHAVCVRAFAEVGFDTKRDRRLLSISYCLQILHILICLFVFAGPRGGPLHSGRECRHEPHRHRDRATKEAR